MPGPLLADTNTSLDLIAGTTATVEVRLTRDGEAVVGRKLTVTPSVGVTALFNTATDADGVVLGTIRATMAGTGQVAFELDDQALTTIALTVRGAEAARVILTVPAAASAGQPVEPPIVATVEDAFGNPAEDTDVTLTLRDAPGLLLGETTQSATGGEATFDDLRVEQTGSFVVQASAGSGSGESTLPLVVGPGPASTLAFDPIEPATALVPLTPVVVRLVDEFGNATGTTAGAPTGLPDRIAVSLKSGPPGGELGGTLEQPVVDGQASFVDLTVNLPDAEWVLEAAATGLGAGASAPFPSQPLRELTGTVTYEHARPTTVGLDYDDVDVLPARRVRVQMLDAAGKELAAGVTDSDGGYALSWVGPNDGTLRIWAQTVKPAITVVDNTAQDAIYVRDFEAVSTGTFDVLLPTGASFGSYGSETWRPAAPFAILGAMITASDHVMAAGVALPSLTVHWSPLNTTYYGSPALGEVGGAHYVDGEIWLLGDAAIDHDEFDRHLVVHEWGHYLERSFGRQDGIGGGHAIGDVLDPRVAFSEGFATALSAMVFAPDTEYIDSYGYMGYKAFHNIVARNLDGDPLPGWFSEASVQALLYDLFDAAGQSPEEADESGFDSVALGFEGIAAILSGPYASTTSLGTIFSFLHGAKTLYPDASDAIDALTEHHSIDPVVDEYGYGESHDGGWSANLPVYRMSTVNGEPVKLPIASSSSSNQLVSNRYVRFQGNGDLIGVNGDCYSWARLIVFHRGEVLADETEIEPGVNIISEAGEEYVAVLQDRSVAGFATSCYLRLVDFFAPGLPIALSADGRSLMVRRAIEAVTVEVTAWRGLEAVAQTTTGVERLTPGEPLVLPELPPAAIDAADRLGIVVSARFDGRPLGRAFAWPLQPTPRLDRHVGTTLTLTGQRVQRL